MDRACWDDKDWREHLYTRTLGPLYGWRRVPRHDSTWFYGCPTLDGLAAWFKGWWQDLARFGYAVYEYEVPDRDFVHHDGTTECIARLARAELARVVRLCSSRCST
jgi:hypothetical protein